MRIEERYCGPPASAHGGVAVGRFAELAGRESVEVRLDGPVPLNTELGVRTEDDGTIIVSSPSSDVAKVRSLDQPISVEPFDLVTADELGQAAAAYLRQVEEKGHPFPTCFGCGPEREVGDGLRQFGGPVPGKDTVAARFDVDGHGPLPTWMTWAGLDCPSAGAVGAFVEDPPPAMVLGTMYGQVSETAHAGVGYQVRGRLLASDGRKHTTEVAMLAPDGTMIGAARAIWIAVNPRPR